VPSTSLEPVHPFSRAQVIAQVEPLGVEASLSSNRIAVASSNWKMNLVDAVDGDGGGVSVIDARRGGQASNLWAKFKRTRSCSDGKPAGEASDTDSATCRSPR